MLPATTNGSAGFDYSTLPVDVATEARGVAERVRSRAQQQITSIIETGRDLASVKGKLGHGNFGTWLNAEFGMTERTAQRYMSTATIFADKTDIVSDLPAAAIYSLAAPSTPQPVRQKVIERLEAGERIDPLEVRDLVKQGKEAEREARVTAKLPQPQQRDRRKAAIKRQEAEAKRHNDFAEKRERERLAAADAGAMVEKAMGEKLAAFLAKLREANLIDFREYLLGK